MLEQPAEQGCAEQGCAEQGCTEQPGAGTAQALPPLPAPAVWHQSAQSFAGAAAAPCCYGALIDL